MEVTLKVGGMSCQNCVKHVRAALESLPGATGVTVDLESGQAKVSGVDPVEAVEALNEEGYPSSVAS